MLAAGTYSCYELAIKGPEVYMIAELLIYCVL